MKTSARVAEAFRNPAGRIALGILALFVVIALLAPLIAPYDPAQHLDVVDKKNLPPSGMHLLGTDSYSRDVLSRMLYGAQTSLLVATLSVIVAVSLGTAVGALAGFLGGRTDAWLMRAVDTLLSIPRLLILLVLAAAVGQLQAPALALVLGLTGWPGLARLVRTQVREIAALDYITAAYALGVPRMRILLRHVLPGVMPQILVATTLAVASVIPFEAGLSFLGIGIPAPAPSWGNIILEGYEQRLVPWWLLVFPGLAIVLTVLAVNIVGDRLRRVVDLRVGRPV